MVEAVIERVVAVVVGRCPAETQMPFSWKTGKKKSVQISFIIGIKVTRKKKCADVTMFLSSFGEWV